MVLVSGVKGLISFGVGGCGRVGVSGWLWVRLWVWLDFLEDEEQSQSRRILEVCVRVCARACACVRKRANFFCLPVCVHLFICLSHCVRACVHLAGCVQECKGAFASKLTKEKICREIV